MDGETSGLRARVNDDRKVGHGRPDELLRAMQGARVEEQRVSRCHGIELVRVPVDDLPRQHIDELHAVVLELRVGVRVLGKRDEIRQIGRAHV